MVHPLSLVAAGVALAAVVPCALAEMVTIGPFDLSPSQEVPPVPSSAFGVATLLLDTQTGDFTLDYSYSGLSSPVTMAHFHQAPVGTNGGVVFWLASMGAPNNLPTTLLDPALPIGATDGAGSGVGIFSQDLIGHALNGTLYINIHTESFPAGELRGQVVPTPGAIALLGLGSCLSVARRRR